MLQIVQYFPKFGISEISKKVCDTRSYKKSSLFRPFWNSKLSISAVIYRIQADSFHKSDSISAFNLPQSEILSAANDCMIATVCMSDNIS